MDCCTGITDLGCSGHCDTIDPSLTATLTGTYKVKIVGTETYKEFSFTNLDPVTFTNFFNENAVTLFQVLPPAGNPLSDGTNDCFSVRVLPSIDLT